MVVLGRFQAYAAVVLFLSVVSAAAAKYSGGSGTFLDPYQIATAADLILLSESPEDFKQNFVLTADIDMDPKLKGGKVFDRAVISPQTDPSSQYYFKGTSFFGVFDGKGHTISHLTIKGGDFLGLFGLVATGSEVKNLGLVAVDITGSGNHVGGLAASNGGDTPIGSMGGGSVLRCYSTGTVSGGSSVGGLVGRNWGAVAQCYSFCKVNGSSHSGGLVGENDNGTVSDCYSTGSVKGGMYIGGLVGFSFGDILRSVWDVQTSGVSRSGGGVGLTTAEMMNPYMLGLNGFGGNVNWVMDAGHDYPRLAWEGKPGGVIPEPDIDWLEGQGSTDAPFRVDGADKLMLLAKASILWDKHFVLCADLDLNPSLPGRRAFPGAFIPVFTGVFDGNDHSISHLTLAGSDYVGFVGQLRSEAEIKNLWLAEANVSGSDAYVGGLVGYNWFGTVTQCCITGAVSASGVFAGGLMGTNGLGSMTRCFSTSTVSSTVGSVGGLVGQNMYGHVTQCYSTGGVRGTENVGGLLGSAYYGDVTQCYSAGPITGPSSAGGLVGHNEGGTATASFWDTQVSHLTQSGGGTGLTTGQMCASSTFVNAGWDFTGETGNGREDIWWISEGKTYPRLSWERRQASSPDPADGAVGVAQPVVLRWRRGGPTLLYDVYLGDDIGLVASATPASAGIYHGRQAADAGMYDPGVLEYNKTYYWRVDGVDGADPSNVWTGRVWRFKAADYVIVDEFEAYDDACNRIFFTWSDGAGYEGSTGCQEETSAGNGTGSTVGYRTPSYAERTVVHSGRQSMPLEYDDSTPPYYSETKRTFSSPQDWTRFDVNTLTIYVRGDPGNAADTLYVGVEDGNDHVKIISHTDPAAITKGNWRQWNIPLSELTAGVDAVDLGRIAGIFLGIGDRSASKGAGRGKVYVDDIRLTRTSGRVSPVAHWEFEEGSGDKAADSAGSNDGTVIGATWVAGKIGNALWFDGIDDRVECGRDSSLNPAEMTLALWVCPESKVATRSLVSKAGTGWSEVDYSLQLGMMGGLVGSFGDGNQTVTVFGAKALAANEWTHVAFTRDGSEAALTIGGTNRTSVGYSLQPGNGGYPFRIGGPFPYQGKIDDVRIYDQALAPDQIEQIAAGE